MPDFGLNSWTTGDKSSALSDIRAATAAGNAAAAAEHGVRVAFEYHGYAACSINNLSVALAVLDALGDPRVGLVIDAFHFYVGSSRLDELERIDGRRVFITHLTDINHTD